MNSLARFNLSALIMVAVMTILSHTASAQTRVKDVTSFLGARENQLIGYGLVVGLDGKGDSDPVLTRQSVANLVKRFGVTIDEADIKAKNSAVVMITAKIDAFARVGQKLDISVASMGDAKSLNGGILLQCPMMGADGQVYAVAQGSVFVGGFFAGIGGAGGATLQKNFPTSGRIPGGALVEKEIPTEIFQNGVLQIVLRQPDFTSAVRIANAINDQLGGPVANAVNSSTVQVFVPAEFQDELKNMDYVARVENVKFTPDTVAKIVINEKTGTIVANSKIKIARVAVAHGNLTVSIVRDQNVSQPNPFTGNVVTGDIGNNNDIQASGAQTVVTESTNLNVNEEKRNVIVLDDQPTIDDVAVALNSLGVTPRDMMTIFQTMKEAGALQAELVLQ
jgi:flagellar P-ring protein precursor FlgI